MQPVIMRQLAADHIREIDAKAEDEHRASEARRVRRPALSAGLRLLASGTLSDDDPRPWTQAVGRSDAGIPAHHRAGDGRLAAR
jgi:hypothetical protein